MNKKQKFQRYQMVHVTKDLPKSMSHFKMNVDAIICGTCGQLCRDCGPDAYRDYQIYILNESHTKILFSSAWYPESTLELLPEQNEQLARKLIDKYERR